MGLRRNTLASADSLAPCLSNSSQAARARGAKPDHSAAWALRCSHSAFCGWTASAASATFRAAGKSPAAAKVSHASCKRAGDNVLASAAALALTATTWRRANAASRGSAAASASSASHHQAGSAGSSGCDSRTAACHAARGWPLASRLCTPCWRSLKRSSGTTALRRAAK